MTFSKIVRDKKISAYRLSKESNVPYMTINDLINRKTLITKCNAETVYKIAMALGTTVEALIEPYMRKRPSFELFKSSVCHRLKRMGDIDFLADLLDSDEITDYYNLGWYPECLYLLAMFDYISRINNIPLCSEYESLRSMKLSYVLYPAGVLAACIAEDNGNAKKRAWESSIPEFRRFNIVENGVRDSV